MIDSQQHGHVHFKSTPGYRDERSIGESQVLVSRTDWEKLKLHFQDAGVQCGAHIQNRAFTWMMDLLPS